MIFSRAFLFSFDIMWRYALVLPVLVIAIALFGLVAALFSFFLGFFSPFLGLVVTMAFGAACSIIPVMAGLRVGVQAHHILPRSSFMGMMAPAIGYGFLEALFALIMIAGAIAAFVLTTPIALADMLSVAGYEDWRVLDAMIDANPGVTIAALVIGGGLLTMLRTALLVPLTGAAMGADPDGRSHTPFYGFGDGFLSLFPLTALSHIGVFFTVPFVIWLAGPLGITDSMAQTTLALEEAAFAEAEAAIAALEEGGIVGGEVSVGSISPLEAAQAYWVDLALIGGMMFVIFLYFFSLQCAGAVLVYLRNFKLVSARMQERDAELTEQLSEAPTAPETDMMELMRSRMPNKKY